jgi:hypothetical protein
MTDLLLNLKDVEITLYSDGYRKFAVRLLHTPTGIIVERRGMKKYVLVRDALEDLGKKIEEKNAMLLWV